MDKIFVDTNVVLDLLQKRESFYRDAQELFTLAENNKVKLFISALTLANVHNILFKHLKQDARKILIKFKVLVEVLTKDDKIINLSLSSSFVDFQDAIQYFTAIENEIDYYKK